MRTIIAFLLLFTTVGCSKSVKPNIEGVVVEKGCVVEHDVSFEKEVKCSDGNGKWPGNSRYSETHRIPGEQWLYIADRWKPRPSKISIDHPAKWGRYKIGDWYP